MKVSPETINPALRDFEFLPNCAMVRLPTVKSLLGISSATAWRLVRDNKLKAYRLTPRTTTFKVADLRAFLSTKGDCNTITQPQPSLSSASNNPAKSIPGNKENSHG